MKEERRNGERWAFGKTAVFAVVGAGILGYHPNAEDGGIYLAEIKRALNPALYPSGTEFVSGHLGPSVFTGVVVGLVRAAGLRLDAVILGLHLLCLWGVLIGVWQLAVRCFESRGAHWGAVGLVSLCLGTPVAGTSLLLMDPYVTARSAAIALTLLGMAGIVGFLEDRRWGRFVRGMAALAGAVTVHPLMGGYGVVEAAALVCLMSPRRWLRVGGITALTVGGLIAAGVAQAFAAPETAEYARVASTRYYWFLEEWQWFELVGLAAPLAILAWMGWRCGRDSVEGGLARMAVCIGAIAVLTAALFAREAGSVHAVARLQPLRCFQMVYVVMLMVIGAWVGERVLHKSLWRWCAAMALVAGLMIVVQRQTYPASDPLELPGVEVANQWEQAFLWVKANTPRNAVVALDADYVHRAGEDAQGFRSVAERSALPDYSKDGGQAAIRPELTPAWVLGQKAQARLTEETDAERWRALYPLGVAWIIIDREGETAFACPYQNGRTKVCRLPDTYQPTVPGAPLNGPAIHDVIHPP